MFNVYGGLACDPTGETHYREKPPGLVGGGSTGSRRMAFVPAKTRGGIANGGRESLSTLANARTGASTGHLLTSVACG